MFGWFKKRPSEREQRIRRFFDAIDELNEAWVDLPDRKLRPWIDWEKRKVMGSTIGARTLDIDTYFKENGDG